MVVQAAHAATIDSADTTLRVAMKGNLEIYPVVDWDKYEFLSILGRGGMGAVYKARDRRLNRLVALKFILGDDPALVQRFLQEAHAQARLDHPNLCRVYEVGQVEGKPYIAMQFISGQPLDRACTEMSLHQKVELIRDAALALHEAHRAGIIHRDIKPANIMVERNADGSYRPIVMDFGLARESGENKGLTQTGMVMGTPGYMPPEQARGNTRSMDRRADVYSLGATLYELLTRQPPFDGDEIVDVLLAVLNDDPRPPRALAPDVPLDLDTIVLKCPEYPPANGQEPMTLAIRYARGTLLGPGQCHPDRGCAGTTAAHCASGVVGSNGCVGGTSDPGRLLISANNITPESSGWSVVHGAGSPYGQNIFQPTASSQVISTAYIYPIYMQDSVSTIPGSRPDLNPGVTHDTLRVKIQGETGSTADAPRLDAAYYFPGPPPVDADCKGIHGCWLFAGANREDLSIPFKASITYQTPFLPAGTYVFRLKNVVNDPDLFVKVGSAPTTSVNDCRPGAGPGGSETCTIDLTGKGGVIHVLIRGYSLSTAQADFVAYNIH